MPSSEKQHGAWILRLLAALAVIAVVIAWQAGWLKPKVHSQPSEDSRPALAGQSVVNVVRHALPRQRVLVGSLQPRSRIELAARIGGRIEKVLVDAGDSVEPGELLMRVDRQIPMAKVAQAKAALARAEARSRGSRHQYQRIKAGYERNVATEVQLIEAEQYRDAAESALERRREALREAETRLSYTEIQSPQTGVVIETLKDPGDQVRPGEPVLTLYDPQRLEFVASVPASMLDRFTPGTEFECEIDALNKPISGVVCTLVPRTDPASRTAIVRLKLDPPPEALPGMFGRLRLPGEARDVLVIPGSAVGRLRQLQFVRVVGDDDRIGLRLVRVGRTMDGSVEVLSGLSEGERVLRDYEAGEPSAERGGGTVP